MAHGAEWVEKVVEVAERGVELGDILRLYASLPMLMPSFAPLPRRSSLCLPDFDPLPVPPPVSLSVTLPMSRPLQLASSPLPSPPQPPPTSPLQKQGVPPHPEGAPWTPTATTRDVVFQAVIPLTEPHMCSWAELVNGGLRRSPQWFVTHVWSSRFSSSLAAMVAAVTGSPTYDLIEQQLANPELVLKNVEASAQGGSLFWFCGLCVNQHRSICRKGGLDSSTARPYPVCGCNLEQVMTGDLSEMNKFQDVIAHLNREGLLSHLVAVDPDFVLFNRAWCVAELVEANRQGMHQELKLHSARGVEEHRKRLTVLDVRNCQASDPKDLEDILAGITDPLSFNEHLRTLLLDNKSGLLPVWEQLVPNYFLDWTGYSPQFMSELRADGGGWRMLAILLLPPMVLLPLCSAFALPQLDDPRSFVLIWRQWIVGAPCWVVGQLVLVMVLLKLKYTDLEKCRTAILLSVGTLMQPGYVQVVVRLSGWWPLPWLEVLAAPCMGGSLIPVWFCIPRELRQKPSTRRLCFMGMLSEMCVLGALVGLPMIAALISKNPGAWLLHHFLATGLLAGRLLLDWVQHSVAKHLSADVMPIMLWFSSMRYEYLLCIVMTRSGTVYLFVQLLLFDVMENCFHLWSLAKQRARASVDVVPTTVIVGREQFILSQLLLRELAQIASPATFLLLLVTLYKGKQRRHHDLVCVWSEEDFLMAIMLMLLDLVAELLVVAVTWFFLRRQGRRPFELLKALLNRFFWGFLLWHYANTFMLVVGQMAEGGSDYSFEFKWLRDGAQWRCGLTWDVA